MLVSSRVQSFFREALGACALPFSQRDEIVSGIIDRFRDFLAEEEEGDDLGIARALRNITQDLVDRHGSVAREVIIRICCETAIAMSVRERDELKRFADDFYFNDEHEHAFISSLDRNRLARELVDGLVAADEIHGSDILEDFDEDEKRQHELIEEHFKTLVDTLHFQGNIETLKYIFLSAFSSHKNLTERDHQRIVDLLCEEGEIWRGVMLARSLELFDPVQRAPAQRIQELQRLTSEGILFSQETFLEENIRSAIAAVFERRIALPGTQFSYKNFFPGEERVSEDTTKRLLEIVSERIIWDLPITLKSLTRELAERPSYHAYCVENLFLRIRYFTSEFLRQVPPSLESEARKLFKDALVRGGGDAYVQWQEREDLKREATRVLSEPVPVPEPVRVSIPVQEFVPPPAALMAYTSPLVIAPSHHAEPPRSLREREGRDVYSAENVLARIAEGHLLHLAEDIRKRPKRFAEALRDHDVQSTAWRALERAMSRGLFGVVERAAPVFLGEDWKMEDSSLRFLARKYFVQELVAERRGDVGHRLPEAVLRQKAVGFGFDWDGLVEEAETQLPKKMKKRKGSS